LKLRQMGTQSEQRKGVFPQFVRLALHVGTRDFCPTLAALAGPVQNIFSSLHTVSIHLSLLPSELGSQSCRVACLLMCVSAHDHRFSTRIQDNEEIKNTNLKIIRINIHTCV